MPYRYPTPAGHSLASTLPPLAVGPARVRHESGHDVHRAALSARMIVADALQPFGMTRADWARAFDMSVRVPRAAQLDYVAGRLVADACL